jgi:predicted Zn-dependent protease
VTRSGAVVALVLAACGSGPRYLGTSLPNACRDRAFEPCFAAVRDLQLAATMSLGGDPELRAYVQRVVDRIARHARIQAPRVVLEEYGTTAYISLGPRLAISRWLLGWLGSEAELAAVLAHELAHLEGRHAHLAMAPTDDWYAGRRDAEAIADERGVELLVRAGYPAETLAKLYERKHDEPASSDDEHPPLEVSAARVRTLAAGRLGGTERRDEYLRRTEGLVVGRDSQLGMRIGGAWVVARLGIALAVTERTSTSSSNTRMWISDPHPGETEVVSRAWGAELARSLEERRTEPSAVGNVIIGVMPRPAIRDTDAVGRALDVWRDEITRWPAGAHVVVVERAHGMFVIALPEIAESRVATVVRNLRLATAAELAASAPARIRLATASKRARLRELVATCIDPKAALALDDPDRVIAAGERFKCTDRKPAE